MWNPFRKLRATDASRLNRLEILVGELSDDVTKCLERTGRIDARLRKRASRDDEPSPELAEGPGGVGPGASGDAPGRGARDLGGAPVDKAALWRLARGRGIA